MAFQKLPIRPELPQRLREIAAEMRSLLDGPQACPVWATKLRDIEADGMSVGLELARPVMEQSAQTQADHAPPARRFRGTVRTGCGASGSVTSRPSASSRFWISFRP